MLVNELAEKYNTKIEFQMPIGVFNVSEQRNIYNSIKIKYQEIAREIRNEFAEKWDSYENPQDKADNIENDNDCGTKTRKSRSTDCIPDHCRQSKAWAALSLPGKTFCGNSR